MFAEPRAEIGGAREQFTAAMGFACDDRRERRLPAALVAAGWAVEKTYGRARLASQSMSDCRPQTKPPPVPSALLSVPMRMWTSLVQIEMLDDAAAVLAEDAGGVGFVDQQHRVVLAASSARRASGARSPSMLKSVSVTISRRRNLPAVRSIASSASQSQCG